MSKRIQYFLLAVLYTAGAGCYFAKTFMKPIEATDKNDSK